MNREKIKTWHEIIMAIALPIAIATAPTIDKRMWVAAAGVAFGVYQIICKGDK